MKKLLSLIIAALLFISCGTIKRNMESNWKAKTAARYEAKIKKFRN